MHKIIRFFKIFIFVFIFCLFLERVLKNDENTEISDFNESSVQNLQELDDFEFRYANIDCDEEDNKTLIPLINALRNKNTKFVENFIKDNKISPNITVIHQRTPLMYSAFYDDTDTLNKLIELGGDVHVKDRFGLNAMSYAISANSINTLKILITYGMKFDESKFVQAHIDRTGYSNIDKLIFKNNSLDIKYLSSQSSCDKIPKYKIDSFRYAAMIGMYDMLKIMLENDYFPKKRFEYEDDFIALPWKNSIDYSAYAYLDDYPHYEKILGLFLQYNVLGLPSGDMLNEAYKKCLHEKSQFKEFLTSDTNSSRYESEKFKNNISAVSKEIKNLYLTNYKFCDDENSTFDINSFFAWANSERRFLEILKFINLYGGDKEKVVY